MKSNTKKRIIAAVLCMVMAVSGNISALAGEEDFADMPVTEETEPVTYDESVDIAFSDGEESSETDWNTETAPDNGNGAMPEDETAPDNGNGAVQEDETAPDDGNGAIPDDGNSEIPDDGNGTETEPESQIIPETENEFQDEAVPDLGDGTTMPEENEVLSQETELTQEFVDAEGNVIRRVTARLPEGAFAAETSAVTMEAEYLDQDSENYIRTMMTERLSEGTELGSSIVFNIRFKVNGEKAEPLQPITITIEGSDLAITDTKKANVFYFDPADPAVEGDKDELAEIPQRSRLLESLQAAGESTENIEDYDLSEITFREDGTTDKIIFEGRRSTIYGCYVEEEKPAEETPEQPENPEDQEQPVEPEQPAEVIGTDPVKTLYYTDEQAEITVSAYEEGIIPDNTELKVVPVTEETDAYSDVEQHIQEKAFEEEKAIAGFLAYDICLTDADGNEIEPNGEVQVSINYKEAAVPGTVSEIGTENTEVSVYHLEEDQNGTVQTVVDMKDTDQVQTLSTTDDRKVEVVEMTTESFSVFTITWLYPYMRNGFKIQAHYGYFDENAEWKEFTDKDLGNKKPEDFSFKSDGQTLDLTTETYQPKIEGYRCQKVTVDQPDNTVSVAALKTEKDWSKWKLYIKYRTVDEKEFIHIWLEKGIPFNFADKTGNIYFVYEEEKPLSIKDMIVEDGSLTVKASEGTIPEDAEEAEYIWYKGDKPDGTKEEQKYSIVKVQSFENGKSNISEDAEKLYPAYDNGARCWYQAELKYKTNDGTEHRIKSEPYQVPYYDEVQNGGFETPDLNGDNIQFSNADYKAGNGVWQSTAEATDAATGGNKVGVEIASIDNSDTRGSYMLEGALKTLDDAEAGEGTNQFAEINCAKAGALYQDVLTMEGVDLNYWLSHRARGRVWDSKQGHDTAKKYEYDEMFLVIVPTKVAKEESLETQEELTRFLKEQGVNLTMYQQDDWNSMDHSEKNTLEKNTKGILILRIVSDDRGWHNITNSQDSIVYQPTSSLTRFFFMAGNTANRYPSIENPSTGNFIDRIGFSQKIPPVEKGKFTITLKKKFQNLDQDQMEVLKDQIKFTISVKDGERYLSEQEISKLLGISSSVISGKNMKAQEDGSLVYTIPERTIENGKVYQVSFTETDADLESYERKTSWKVTVNQNETRSETDDGEMTAVINELTSGTAAEAEFVNAYFPSSITVEKKWVDNEFTGRPEEIQFDLYSRKKGSEDEWEKHSGSPYTLSAENNWKYTVTELKLSEFEYKVQEINVPEEYYSSIQIQGSNKNQYVITNTLKWMLIKKNDAGNGETSIGLQGAKFKLTDSAGKLIASGTSEADGTVKWNKADALYRLDGTYSLQETAAPSGYQLHEAGWTLTFEKGLLIKAVDNRAPDTELTIEGQKEKGAVLTVVNVKAYELPSTGGNGVFGYMVSGTLLMMAAALIYIIKIRGVRKS